MGRFIKYFSRHAGFSVSEGLAENIDAVLAIRAEKGTLSVHNPLAPHLGHTFTADSGQGSVSEQLGGTTTYHYRLKRTVDVIEDGAKPLTGGADSIDNMRAIDSIYRVAANRAYR